MGIINKELAIKEGIIKKNENADDTPDISKDINLTTTSIKSPFHHSTNSYKYTTKY